MNMASDSNNWSYNEFLAFLLVYAAGMDCHLSAEELEFIRERTKIEDIGKINTLVQSVNDIAILDIVEDYRKKYLDTPAKEQQAKTDLENLLHTPGAHSQFEKAGVHLLEKIILRKAV
jgi:hypothetical protein